MTRDTLVRLSFVLVALCAPGVALAQDGSTELTPEERGESPVAPPPVMTQPATSSSERACADATDDDGDGMTDCADADCFEAANCQAGGREERTDAACGDWIDNDGDGAVDCDDEECHLDFIRVCRGSWSGAQSASTAGDEATVGAGSDDLPELAAGQSVEDLIGTGGDADGERSDETCADGVDNDMDGRADCADFGCRFDPQVTVCQGTPGLRFSVVAGVGARITLNYTNTAAGEEYTGNVPDAGFTLMQLRALGPIPFINNSFFLINIRADDRVRLSFANFQIPLSNSGHYLSLNSGSGSLSTGLIVSAARQPLLEAPFYLFSAFEQGNGAALETGGPIDSGGILRFRLYAAAGSGEFTGNVGGRFFRSDDRNFAFAGGGQLQINIIGHYDRFDSPFIYTPVPLTLGLSAGVKYDQRPNERFVAWHAYALFRWFHFGARFESYSRYVLDYDAIQTAFNFQLVALIVPRVLMFAGDVGGFYRAQDYTGLPTGSMTPAGVDYQPEQFQFRLGLHWYYFRNVATLSAIYSELHREHQASNPLQPDVERVIRLESRFRF